MATDYKNYMSDEHLLEGRVILVTGASHGIGRAVAIASARCGGRVVLHGRDTGALQEVYDEICKFGRATPAIIPLDFSKLTQTDCDALAKAIEDEIGQLDGLVHNAGVLGLRTPIEQYSEEAWRHVLEVNLTAPFLLTRSCLPLLKKSKDASIVFTSSGVGRRGKAYWGAYAVSKFGTEGLMQTLADECENTGNIRVNCVNPGATRTSMRRQAYPGEDPNSLSTPEEIVGPWLFLLSEAAKNVNGESLDAQPK